MSWRHNNRHTIDGDSALSIVLSTLRTIVLLFFIAVAVHIRIEHRAEVIREHVH